MPAVILRGSSSSSGSSSSAGSSRIAVSEVEVKKAVPVVIVVEGDSIAVYTEQEAVDILAKG